jgi:predicted dehydrogenase
MIRFAIIGCGKVVEAFHVPALAQVPGLMLSAVVDVDAARARALAARAGAPDAQVATHVREVIDACDAALIALPNHLHASVGALLLEHGRHVLIEKPMATTVAECTRLVDAARASGAVLGVAMVRRFTPAYQFVADLAASRAFGPVTRITVREGVVYNWPATTGFFVKRAESGGGVLVDFGPHVIDGILSWIGPLTATSYEDDAYGGVEAECRVTLTASAGAAIDVELSRLRLLPCTARVEFERATVEVNLRSGAVDLAVGGSSHPVRGQAGSGAVGAWTPGVDPFALQLAAFRDDIVAGRGVLPTALAARDIAVLFEQCGAMRRPMSGPATPAVDRLGEARA